MKKDSQISKDLLEESYSDLWFTVKDKLAIKSLVVNFMPSWWNKNYKVSFGERYFFNPDYRIEVVRYMSRTINQHFPDLNIGLKNPQPEVVLPSLGCATGVAAAGGEIFYPEDNYPWSKHLSHEAIEKLKLPKNIEEVFPFNEVISQTKYLNNKLNKDFKPYLVKNNGILNSAMLIMGDELLLDLAYKKDIAKKVLEYCYEMWIKIIDYNNKVNSFPNIEKIGNCTAIMIGPERYEESLFSYDRDIIQRCYDINKKIMLHHCGKFDNFIPSYRRIPHADMLQIGYESNIKNALEAFPESDVEYFFSPYLIRNGSRNEIEGKTNEILESARGNWDRFSIILPDIDYGSPDENVSEVYECCKKAA